MVRASANASAVKRRIQKVKNATKPVSRKAMIAAAQDTIKAVEISALRKLSHRQDQVGFDLEQFIENIQGVEFDGEGVAILDLERMGTIEDLEDIEGVEGLWHHGTRSGDKFRKAVFDHATNRYRVAELRQDVWGEKTPQWVLMEYGSHSGGENPPVPAAHFIGSVKDDPNKILTKWKRFIKDAYDESGVND